MTSPRGKEVLYDSEVMLRLVDNELAELRELDGNASAKSGMMPGADARPATRPVTADVSDDRKPAP